MRACVRACVRVCVDTRRLTLVNDPLYVDVVSVSHETEHGEDDEAGKHARTAVDERHDDRVSVEKYHVTRGWSQLCLN